MILSTQQMIHPPGRSSEFHGRPVDLVVAADHKTVYVKSNDAVIVIDADSWKIRQTWKYPGKNGASLHGIVLSQDGSRLYVTTGQSSMLEAQVEADGTLTLAGTIRLPASQGEKRETYPCGLALWADRKTAYVCLNAKNVLAVVNLDDGTVKAEIPVGIAPYAVCISPDGQTAYVTNWGGRRPRAGDSTAKSYGTDVVIDQRGTAATGTLSVVDLTAMKEAQQIETALHPSDLLLAKGGQTLYVACASSDTVSVIDTTTRKVTREISVRPDPALAFGSMPNALALSDDGKNLFVAVGGNNAVAVIDLDGGAPAAPAPSVAGFIPAGWYPGALAVSGKRLMIANVKGLGSRDPSVAGKWNTHSSWGSVLSLDLPDRTLLSQYTQQVKRDGLVPQSLKAWERAHAGMKAAPVPRRVGEPSVFEHVVYIIKENRTYDQVFGDIRKGNGEPSLCIFGREVTPNHHALAEQFALLDNFYDNGVLSADGHAWATEGVAVDYLEKSFGAWVRSYPAWGDDPLAISPTGFIWDGALLHGLTFRNYGEMAHSSTSGSYDQFLLSTGSCTRPSTDTTMPTTVPEWSNELGPKVLAPYTHPTFPGWNLSIPDAMRAEVFIADFSKLKQQHQFPNLTIIYLPTDHTRGTAPDAPTPAAMVADNDLALGRIVEAISHSPFWATTCIFAIEDDPQNGFDHVDGHRSICLVISPYTKRGEVVSEFFNQTSVLHTMELMLGLPPMNQMDAMAPAMGACFGSKADLTPYTHVPNRVPLDQKNPPKTALSGMKLELAEQSATQNFDEPDRADENTLNRILWHAQKGVDASYPASFAGAHGRGLKKLHLTLNAAVDTDDDD